MRNKLKHAAAATLHTLGLRRLAARCLVYHEIVLDDVRDAGQMTTSVADFEWQMAYLASNGFKVVDALTAVRALSSGALPERSVVITFDDGLQSVELALPILRRHGLSATAFLIANALQDGRIRGRDRERFLRTSDVSRLASSGVIAFGCHGATHRRLRGLSEEDVQREVAGAQQLIGRETGTSVALFAYPFGSASSFDASTVAAVRAAGFVGAFTGIQGTLEPNDLFRLARCRVSWAERGPRFVRLLDGSLDWYAAVQRLQSL